MKQRIRITEGQIRRAVNHAVNNLLREATGLDWKTYANAAGKAYKRQGEWKGRDRYNNMSVQRDLSFNDKYGRDISLDTHTGSLKPFSTRDDSYIWPDSNSKTGFSKGKSRYSASDTTPEDFFGDNEKAVRFRNATKEVDDYNNGNYDYQKGKGWQLKNESYSRRGRMLREGEEDVYDRYGGHYGWQITKIDEDYGGETVDNSPHAFFSTPEEAQEDGLYALKMWGNEGVFALDVADYKIHDIVDGYSMINDHGRIRKA